MAKANRCLSLLLSLEILFACSCGMAADRYQLIGKITLKDREYSRKTLSNRAAGRNQDPLFSCPGSAGVLAGKYTRGLLCKLVVNFQCSSDQIVRNLQSQSRERYAGGEGGFGGAVGRKSRIRVPCSQGNTGHRTISLNI